MTVGSAPAKNGSVRANRARDVAAEIRPEPPVLLLVGGAVGEEFHVAAVRSLNAEHGHRHHAPADDLRHQGQLQLAEADAAELRVEEGSPQSPRLDLVLQVVLDDLPLVAG